MSKGAVRCTVVAAATLLSAMPLAWAFSTGALPGYNGGRAGDGANCVACHPFNEGSAQVELIGAPQRYRNGEVYDLTARISAPGLTDHDGTGFELSAEGSVGHVGTLLVIDPMNTQYTDGLGGRYVTHTADGVLDSRITWLANGESYNYHLQWRAPDTDAGPVTFFTAFNAVDNSFPFGGVHYYFTYAMSRYALPGDVDADGDVGLTDHASLVSCLGGPGVPRAAGCEFADTDNDGDVDVMDAVELQLRFTDDTATVPGAYVLADVVRGGRLYDKWWVISGAAEPIGFDHPLYPAIGAKSGSTTFRCKECHGWDYKGRDGAYGVGSTHYTGIVGVQGTTLTPQQLFDLLKSPDTAAGGHNMAAYGMTDRDLWDVVKMVLDGVVETSSYIDATGTFLGNAAVGQAIFGTCSTCGVCAKCHGPDGTDLVFHGGEHIGTVASGNPWEFLHKVRFGHPGAPMPSFELLNWSVQDAADIGVYAATLPP